MHASYDRWNKLQEKYLIRLVSTDVATHSTYSGYICNARGDVFRRIVHTDDGIGVLYTTLSLRDITHMRRVDLMPIYIRYIAEICNRGTA